MFRKLGVNRYLIPSLTNFDNMLISQTLGRTVPVEKLRSLSAEYNCLELYVTLEKDSETAIFEVESAIKSGYLDMIKWMGRHGYRFPMNLPSIAAANGHVHILQWWYMDRPLDSPTPFMYAAENGRIEVLKYLLSIADPDKKSPIRQKCVVNAAAYSGSIELMQWLLDRGAKLPKYVARKAAAGCHIPLLKWLYDRNCDMTCDLSVNAATHGRIIVLQWLYSMSIPLDKNVPIYMCKRGKVSDFEWLKSLNFKFTADTSRAAAYNQNFEVLKWLYAEGVPLSIDVIKNIAYSDRTDIIKWLISVNCPWDVSVPFMAVYYGRLENLKLLIENGCPYDPNMQVSDVYRDVAEYVRTLS